MLTLRDIPHYTDFPLTAEVGLYKNTNKGKESDGTKTKVVAKKKILLVSLLLVFLLFVMTFSMPPAFAQADPVLSVLPKVTEPPPTLAPGDPFVVSVAICHVEDMWGFEFSLYFNKDVLEWIDATHVIFPLTWGGTPKLADDHVNIAASYPIGTAFDEGFNGSLSVGFPIPSPYEIVAFSFKVKDYGYSQLDIRKSSIVTTRGLEIDHDTEDGYFINVPPVMEADFTAWKAKALYQPNWDMSVEPNTLRGRMWNKGTVGLYAKVVFTITKDGFSETFDSNVVSLAPGQKGNGEYDLTAADIGDTPGTYKVTAQVSYWKIIESPPVTPNGATIKTFTIKAS